MDEHPFTLNVHYLSRTQKKILHHFQEARRNWNPDQLDGKVAAEIDSALAKGSLPTDKIYLARLFEGDAYETELDVMASTRAYCQVDSFKLVAFVVLKTTRRFLLA